MRLLRTAATASGPQPLPQLGRFAWANVYAGAPERALDYYEGNIQNGFFNGIDIMNLWAPSYAALRKTARFKAYVRSAGMVDYWRVKGWPDQCHPTTGDDFECS